MKKQLLFIATVASVLLFNSCEKEYIEVSEMPTIDVPYNTNAGAEGGTFSIGINSTVPVALLVEEEDASLVKNIGPSGNGPFDVNIEANMGYTRDIRLLAVNADPNIVYLPYGSIMLFTNIHQEGPLGTRYVENSYESRMQVNEDTENCYYITGKVSSVKSVKESAWYIPENVKPSINGNIHNTEMKTCLQFDIALSTGDTLEVNGCRYGKLEELHDYLSIKSNVTIEAHLPAGSYRGIMEWNKKDTRRFKMVRISDIRIL